MINFAEAAEGLVVLDLDGKEVPVSSLWANGTIVLAFIRHFG